MKPSDVCHLICRTNLPPHHELPHTPRGTHDEGHIYDIAASGSTPGSQDDRIFSQGECVRQGETNGSQKKNSPRDPSTSEQLLEQQGRGKDVGKLLLVQG